MFDLEKSEGVCGGGECRVGWLVHWSSQGQMRESKIHGDIWSPLPAFSFGVEGSVPAPKRTVSGVGNGLCMANLLVRGPRLAVQ